MGAATARSSGRDAGVAGASEVLEVGRTKAREVVLGQGAVYRREQPRAIVGESPVERQVVGDVVRDQLHRHVDRFQQQPDLLQRLTRPGLDELPALTLVPQRRPLLDVEGAGAYDRRPDGVDDGGGSQQRVRASGPGRRGRPGSTG